MMTMDCTTMPCSSSSATSSSSSASTASPSSAVPFNEEEEQEVPLATTSETVLSLLQRNAGCQPIVDMTGWHNRCHRRTGKRPKIRQSPTFCQTICLVLLLIVSATICVAPENDSAVAVRESRALPREPPPQPAGGLEPYWSLMNELNRKRLQQKQQQHSLAKPFNVILILPEKESNNDKFGLTVAKVRPVIDIAIEAVERHETMRPGWINITYHDSRYWEDTLLAERVAATGVVQV